jgi:hypothetical protein
MLPDPTKPPTPQEFAVRAWFVAGALVVAGVIGLVFALTAAPEKHAQAEQLEKFSVVSVATGMIVVLVIWFYRKFVD